LKKLKAENSETILRVEILKEIFKKIYDDSSIMSQTYDGNMTHRHVMMLSSDDPKDPRDQIIDLGKNYK